MTIARHADHDPALPCRPAFGNGLCEPLSAELTAQIRDALEASERGHITEAEYAASLPGRLQEIAGQLSEGLPDGMRFEFWGPAPSKDACSRCGRDPAAGYATGVTGKRLCHPDPLLHPDESGEDCYHITQGGKLHR